MSTPVTPCRSRVIRKIPDQVPTPWKDVSWVLNRGVDRSPYSRGPVRAKKVFSTEVGTLTVVSGWTQRLTLHLLSQRFRERTGTRLEQEVARPTSLGESVGLRTSRPGDRYRHHPSGSQG